MESEVRLLKGFVTHILDPSNFWMKLFTDQTYETYQTYQNELNSLLHNTCDDDAPKADNLEEEQIVAVKIESEGKTIEWRRAQILRIDLENNKVDIFFIDFGSAALASIKDIREIENGHYPPPEAVRSGLTAVKPLTNQWTKRSSDFMKSLVLNQHVIAVVYEVDTLTKYCRLAVYYWDSAETCWSSLSHRMCNEEIALPSNLIEPATLSQEDIDAYFENLKMQGKVIDEIEHSTEDLEPYDFDFPASASNDMDPETNTENSVNNCNKENENRSNNNSCEDQLKCDLDDVNTRMRETDINADEKEFAATQDEFVNQSNKSRDRKELPPLFLPTPAQFEEPICNSSNSTETPGVDVPGFNLNALSCTNSVSVYTMRSKVRQATQEELLATFDSEDDDSDKDKEVHDWGTSDLELGNPEKFSDAHKSVAQQINSLIGDQSDDEHKELHEFLQGKTNSFHESFQKANRNPDEVLPYSTETVCQPLALTEEQLYALEQEILTMLTTNYTDSETLSLLVSTTVDPQCAGGKLTAVINSVIECLVTYPHVDHINILAVLDAYCENTFFEETFVSCLRAAKYEYLKRNSKRNTHKYFARFMANLFDFVPSWGPVLCSTVRNYIVSTLDTLCIFNLKRSQEGEKTLETESLYLESVKEFFLNTQSFDVDGLENISKTLRQKLVCQKTESWLREILLDILLIIALKGAPVMFPERNKYLVDVSTQTHEQKKYENTRHVSSVEYSAGRYNKGGINTETYNPSKIDIKNCNANNSENCNTDVNDTKNCMAENIKTKNEDACSELESNESLRSVLSNLNAYAESFKPTEQKKRKMPKSLLQVQRYLQTPIFDTNFLSNNSNVKVSDTNGDSEQKNTDSKTIKFSSSFLRSLNPLKDRFVDMESLREPHELSYLFPKKKSFESTTDDFPPDPVSDSEKDKYVEPTFSFLPPLPQNTNWRKPMEDVFDKKEENTDEKIPDESSIPAETQKPEDSEIWHSPNTSPVLKKKKKKKKYISLDEFESREESSNDFVDEFSEEAIQNYVELDEFLESQRSIPTTTRTKLLPAVVNPAESTPSSWAPKMFCSKCCGTDHRVYQCPTITGKPLL